MKLVSFLDDYVLFYLWLRLVVIVLLRFGTARRETLEEKEALTPLNILCCLAMMHVRIELLL